MSRWLPPSQLRGRKKVVYALAIGVLTVGTLSAVGSQSNAAAPQPPWLNPNKPIQARVSALLGAMTLPEKLEKLFSAFCKFVATLASAIDVVAA